MPTPRVEKVPIDRLRDPPDDSEAKLFVASRTQSHSAFGTLGNEYNDLLYGFATPNVRNGDNFIQFLESHFCLVLRETGSGEHKYIGCAIIPKLGDRFTDDLVDETALKIDHLILQGSALSYDQFHIALSQGQGIDGIIDLESLQFIKSIRL